MELVKKIISALVRISISIFLLIFLFKQVDKARLFEIIRNADKSQLCFAFLIFFFVYFLCYVRWDMLLKAAKILLPFKRTVVAFAGGIFFNLFLPSTIGGDFVRSVDLATHTKKPSEVLATVILDRLSGFVGLVCVALLALLLGSQYVHDRSVVLSIGAIAIVLFTILLALFNTYFYTKINRLLQAPEALAQHISKSEKHKSFSFFRKIRELLKNVHHEIHLFRHHKKVVGINLVLSLIIQFMMPLLFYFIGASLGIHINIFYYLIYIPIIGAITLLPISIGGLGLRDAMTIFFFAQAGVSKDLAFAMSLLNFFFMLVYAGIGGLIYVLTVHHRRL